jgi:hypothetical protein
LTLSTPRTSVTKKMSFIKNLFKKKSAQPESSLETDLSKPSNNPATDTTTTAVETGTERDVSPENQKNTVVIPPPPKDNLSQHQNAGMLAGGVIADVTDQSVGLGMVDGLVAGNIISQKVNQVKKQAYWKEQAQNYQAGLPAAGVGDERVSTPVQGRDRGRSEGREERRKSRWGRRAERQKD